MDTTTVKKDSSMIQVESSMLAKKALSDVRAIGKTNVRCPKCGEIPNVSLGNRTTVLCECHFIMNGEII